MKFFYILVWLFIGISSNGAVNLYQTNSGGNTASRWGHCFTTLPTGFPFTIAGWVKPWVTNSSKDVFGFQCTTNSNARSTVRLASGGSWSISAGDASGSGSTTDPSKSKLGVWQHIAAVFINPSNRVLYVDGIYVQGTTNGTARNSVGVQDIFVIGGGRPITTAITSGGPTAEIADVGIWSVQLNDDEIKSLASVKSIPRMESLIDFWPLHQQVPIFATMGGLKGNVADFWHAAYTNQNTNGAWTTPGPTGLRGINIPPAVPTWGGEVDRVLISGDYTTNKLTLSGSIAAGKTAVLLIGDFTPCTSVADSKGNTWTVNATNTDGFGGISIASAYITSGLESGDVVTATMAGAGFHGRVMFLHYVNDAASSGQPDQVTSATGFSTSPSASASTTASRTALVGIVSMGDPSYTYSSSAWTAGTELDSSARSWVPVYKDATSAGSQNPAGTISSSGTWFEAWIALK